MAASFKQSFLYILATLISGGCASSDGHLPNHGSSQVLSINNSTIQGTDIRILNILGGVAGIPDGSYSNYRGLIDTPGIQKAKSDLQIMWSNPRDLKPDLEPTAVGWRASINYSVDVLNRSSSVTYTISGAGIFGGVSGDKFIRSDSGRIQSNTLRLAPGRTGTLTFSGKFVVQDILVKARQEKIVLNEQMVYFIPPNDGAEWRPNWPDALGLVGLVAQASEE